MHGTLLPVLFSLHLGCRRRVLSVIRMSAFVILDSSAGNMKTRTYVLGRQWWKNTRKKVEGRFL